MTGLKSASQGPQARRARGGAMVEFVVLNVVLVPLLLYAIFLMDAAYLKLDLQETVVSGVWDFSVRNTEPPAGSGSVGPSNGFSSNNGMELQSVAKAVRIVYADHTSAFDDGGEADSDDYGNANRLRGNGDGSTGPKGHMRHHTGFGAQYTFRFKAPPPNAEEDEEEGTNSGGALEGVGTELDTQFKCRIVEDMGWSLDPNMTAFGQSGYNAGGEARCSSIGFIYNYIVPEKFLQEFSETDKLTALKRRRDESADGAHKYQGEGGRAGNIIAEETAAISFNTWALRNGAKQSTTGANGYGAQDRAKYTGKVTEADIGDRPPPFSFDDNDPKDNPFFRRVQYMYSSPDMIAFGASYLNVAGRTASFMSKGANTKLITAYAVPIPPVGPVPPTQLPAVGVPNMAGVFMAARYKPGQPGLAREAPKTGGFLSTGGSFLSTPYSGHNSNYQTAAGNRGRYYMGCQSEENPDCF